MALTIEPPGFGVDRPRRSPRDRRTVTVLFADVVGSTASTAKSDLEVGYARISPAVEITVAVVQRHGGTINKLLGDGVMATFGAPVMLEDHALRACRCALAIQVALGQARDAGAAVTMRVGINTGPALITEDVEGTHTTYDTHGPTVNLVSRIEAEAAPGSVYISASTFRLVRSAFTCREIGVRPLKGFDEQQLLYELLREETHEELRGLAGHRIATPFIGREGDLAMAMQALARLQSGRGGFLLIVGEAGVGKSRFLAEVQQALPGELQWLEGHCQAFTQRISFWPYIELLRPVIGLNDPVAPSGNWQKLQYTMTDLLDREAAEFLPYVATLLSMEVPAADQERLRDLDPKILGAQIFRAVRRLFERMAARRPLVLVLEDVHWGDFSSRKLLEHLLPLAKTLPILFVGLSRPEPEGLDPLRKTALQELPSGYFGEIVLSPLSVAESQRLLVGILGNDERLGRLRDRILYKVEGNPFFLEEVVRELIDLRALVRDEVHGTWSARDLDIAIPQTVEGVLMARIDRLDERLRDLLGVAAVIGRTFLYRLLRAVTVAEVDEPLAKLSAGEMIEQLRSAPELSYLFRHALTHQAVYDSLLIDRRRQLHARVAAILEELYAGRLQEITSLLAFHYSRAQNSERSLHYLLQAAQQSSRMAADGEALALLEEAVASYWRSDDVTPHPEQRAFIEWQLGEIYFRRGDHACAEEHLLRAIELSGDPMPNRDLTLHVALTREFIRHAVIMLLRLTRKPKFIAQVELIDETRFRPYETLGWIYFLSDQRRLLLVILRSANLAERLGYVEAIVKAHAALGFGLTSAGWPRIASRYHRGALALAERLGDRAGGVFAALLWGTFLFVRGRWREAEQVFEDVRLKADQMGELLVWSDASGEICQIWNETAEFARVLEFSETMTARGQEAAFRPALRWGLAERGKALRRLGRVEEAYPILSQAFEMCAADKDIIGCAVAGGDLAMALITLRRPDEAARMLAELRQRIVDHRIRMYPVCGVYVALAELALLRFEAGTGTVGDASRACAAALRLGRNFSIGRAASLRLAGRLAWLSRQPRRADRIWRRAAAVAEALGATYELALIKQERDSRWASAGGIYNHADPPQ
jgi:class 3 adenylate cyclase/tetratricopeptide (TPR) repeat protein